MPDAPTPSLLRPRSLDGVSVLLAHARSTDGAGSLDSPAAATASAIRELRGAVAECALATAGPPAGADAGGADAGRCEAAVERALAEAGALDVLVLDADSLFERAAEADAHGALERCLQTSWALTRAVVTSAFLDRSRRGRVLYLAPTDAGGHEDRGLYARAARAGLENLARTLSIEWSRHAVTTVAILPGARTQPYELAQICAYLASPAGAYFSGCVLDLSGPAPASGVSKPAR